MPEDEVVAAGVGATASQVTLSTLRRSSVTGRATSSEIVPLTVMFSLAMGERFDAFNASGDAAAEGDDEIAKVVAASAKAVRGMGKNFLTAYLVPGRALGVQLELAVLGAVSVDEPGQHDRRFGPVHVGGFYAHPLKCSLEVAHVGRDDLQDRVGRP